MNFKEADTTLRNAIRPSDLRPVREAALAARLNEFTVWKLIRQGKLRAYGRPGSLRVSVDDLLAPYQPKAAQ